jgi:signal transduction histidine kinase
MGDSTVRHDEDAVAHFVTTRATKILSADAATATLLQRTTRSLIGKPLAVLLEIGDREEFRSRLVCLPEDGAINDWHLRLIGPDGGAIATIATVEAMRQPMIDGTETSLRWSMVAESAPRVASPASAPAHEALEQLTAELVHELNQPLAAIVGYARGCVLRSHSKTLSAEVLETAMEHIVTEATRAAGLLRAAAERWRQTS